MDFFPAYASEVYRVEFVGNCMLCSLFDTVSQSFNEPARQQYVACMKLNTMGLPIPARGLTGKDAGEVENALELPRATGFCEAKEFIAQADHALLLNSPSKKPDAGRPDYPNFNEHELSLPHSHQNHHSLASPA